MIKYILFLVLCSSNIFAATSHCILPGGSGSFSGADWNNAYKSIPTGALIRGDTYYIGAGSYSTNSVLILNTANSGANYIYFKAASHAANSGDAGWSDSFIGVATFTNTASQSSVIRIDTSYWDFDGITGSGTNLTYGIHLGSNSTTDGPAAVEIDYNTPLSSNPQNCFFRHMEMNVARWGNANGARVFDIQAAGCTNIWILNCFLHGGRVWVSSGGGTNQGCGNCYMNNCGSDDGSLHSAGFTISGTFNYWITNCVLENMLGSANTTYVEPQANPVNFYVIGNIFKSTSSSELTDLGIVAMTSTDVATGLYVTSNTSYGLHGAQNGVWGGLGGSTVYCTNNVFQNMSGSTATFSFVTGAANNIVNNSVSFVNAANGNFHLSANTSSGTSLDSPYNVDPDGITRGSGGQNYSIGAFQYVVSSPSVVFGTIFTHP